MRAAAGRPVAWITLVLLTGLNLCNYLDRYVVPAVLSPIERDLRLDDRQFGLVATLFMVGYFCTSPFFGYLGDRLPRRWLVLGGVLVWCAGTMLSGRAGGFVELGAFRVLVGLGEASYGTISPGWIADLYPADRRNTALSLFYLAIPVGSALGFILGGALALRFGWRTAFLLAGLPGLLFAVALGAVSEPERGGLDRETEAPAPANGEPAGWAGALRAYRTILSSRAYGLVVAGYVAQTFAMGGFAVWAAGFLEREHHLAYAAADRFFGVAAAATGLVGTLAGGFVGTAWQRRSAAGYARLLAVSAVAAVPFSFLAFLVPNLAAAKACLVAAMFLLFLSTGPVNTLILETAPAALRASAMAASIFAIHLFGDLWSPTIVGVLSDWTGDLREAIVWTLPPAIAVCAACWAWLAVIPRPPALRPAPRPRSGAPPPGTGC